MKVKELLGQIYNEKNRAAFTRLMTEDEVLEHEFLVLDRYLSQTKHIPPEVITVVDFYKQILGLQPFNKEFKRLYGDEKLFWLTFGCWIFGKVMDPLGILRWIGHKQVRTMRIVATAGLEYMEMVAEEKEEL